MAAAGAIGGAIIGSTNQAIGTIYSGEQSRKAQRRSIRFQREMAKNRISYMTQDLRRAGLNPILATGLNPGSQAGAPYSGVSQASGAGAAAGAQAGIQAASAKAQIALNKEKLLTEDAMQQNAYSQADAARWRGVKDSSEADLNNILRTESGARAGNLDASARKLDIETMLLGATAPSAQTRKGFRESWLGKGSQYFKMIREDLGLGNYRGPGGAGSGGGVSRGAPSGKGRLGGPGGRPSGTRRR